MDTTLADLNTEDEDGELSIIDPLEFDATLPPTDTGLSNIQHWRHKEFGDPIKDDFRVFLTLLWRYLGLPDPTELQLDVAYHLQHHGWNGEIDRLIIMAFRGMAKSWITAAFVLWNLLRDPQLKIGVFSGSARRSVNFVNFCINLISQVPELQHLRPLPHQRQSSSSFDVGPSRPDQTPSVFAAGITSAIVGFRADIIVGDDVETNTNSMTPDMREKIADATKEFDAIIKPGGQIIFLGTPQTEASIYNVLRSRGYTIIIWPARFPTGKQRRRYGEQLAPYVSWKIDQDPHLVGTSTEPTRFTEADLAGRELSWGPAGFALQYMLDTSLADVDRYPLRLRDVITMYLDPRTGPNLVSWGGGEHLRVKDVQPICLDGDGLYGPASVSDAYSKWDRKLAFIDPSGRGADEATLTIGVVLNSTLYAHKQGGWLDGYAEDTLKEMAQMIVTQDVRLVRVEDNFGGGMFADLLRPYVKQAWEKANQSRPKDEHGVTKIESERASKVQKELRILEVLEPIFHAHRLVVNTALWVEDAEQIKRRKGTELRDRYSFMYQLTRLTREKDCLTHDDRIEGLAGLAGMVQSQMGLMPAEQAEEQSRLDMEEAILAFDKEYDDLQGVVQSGQRLRGKLRGGEQRADRRH